VKQIPDNTLAHYDRMPQVRVKNLSAINCQLFAANVAAYRGRIENDPDVEVNTVSPDAEALRFYLFNHLASLVRERFTTHEVLPGWAQAVMLAYKNILCEQGLRLTSYMALISIRESRHLYQMDDSWWTTQIEKKYGPKFKVFHDNLGKSDDSDAVVKKFLEHAPAMPVGDFFHSVETTFFEGSYGGSFGGVPWGNITKCLTQFLDGKTSQEMMVDTAYTLAHNNGPMFNKGMLYDMYSPAFKTILDVQRSGQIPEYVFENKGVGLISDYQAIYAKARAEMPECFGKYVDWFKVEKDGGLNLKAIKIQQKLQEEKYGKTPVYLDGKQVVYTGEFKIAPGVAVPIYKRLETA